MGVADITWKWALFFSFLLFLISSLLSSLLRRAKLYTQIDKKKKKNSEGERKKIKYIKFLFEMSWRDSFHRHQSIYQDSFGPSNAAVMLNNVKKNKRKKKRFSTWPEVIRRYFLSFSFLNSWERCSSLIVSASFKWLQFAKCNEDKKSKRFDSQKIVQAGKNWSWPFTTIRKIHENKMWKLTISWAGCCLHHPGRLEWPAPSGKKDKDDPQSIWRKPSTATW